GTTHWDSPNEGATNSSGFTGLPCGVRGYDGSYLGYGFDGCFWSATEYDAAYSYCRSLSPYNTFCYNGRYIYKTTGASVRCIKD
ncbi:MAG: hypothetical protein EOM11_10815, partial [Erysipelotrichia bacterium]|nr:hypothetical protein [Erysipelotrichia bacterium]